MSLDFKVTGADDGYNNADSVQPYNNGEAANQTIFRRTPENLRTRTEVVRKSIDDFFLTGSADRSLLLAAADNVQATWNGTVAGGGGGDGKWSINTGWLNFVPVIGSDLYNAKNDIASRLAYKIATDVYFTVRARHESGAEVRAHNGANNLRIELFKVDTVTLSAPVVTVEGSNVAGTYDPGLGPVLVRVQLSHDTQIRSTWKEVVDAIDAHGVASTFLRTFVANPSGTPGGSDYAVEIAEQFLWEGTGTDVSGVGAVDAQAFKFSKSEIDTFFASGGGVAGMAEGDAVVVEFETARDRLDAAGNASVGAALRLLHRDENDAADDDDKFSSVGNTFQGNSIAVCRVIAGDLYFSNGTVLSKDETGYIRNNDARLRADLASQSAPVGASLVGNGVLTGIVYNQPAGNLSTQIGNIFADADDLQRSYDEHIAGTSQKHADTAVTAAEKTQGTHTVTAGSVNSQVDDVIGLFDAHVAGSADKHTLGKITGKPFVTVSPTAGEGDYQTIQAAITAIAGDVTIPSLVYIKYKAGGYAEGLSFAGMVNRSIRFVGEDRNRVLVLGNVTAPAVTISAFGLNSSITFENLTFMQGAASSSQTIEITASVTDDKQKVIFRDCNLARSSGDPRMLYVTGAPKVEFLRCHLDSYNYSDATGWGDVDSDDGPTIVISACHVTDAYHLLAYKTTGSDPGHLSFCHNEIERCGYNKSDGTTLSALLHTENSSILLSSIRVCNNHWRENTDATPNENSGSLLNLTGEGVVSNNVLKQPVHYAPTALSGVINANRFAVTGNYIESGKCCAIVGWYSTITGNRISDFQGGAANMPAIHAAQSVVSDNTISCSTVTPPVCDEIIDLVVYVTGSRSVASGNKISGVPAIIGIHLSGYSCSAIGNVIDFNANGVGIDVASIADYCVVSGNELRNALTGVRVNGSFTAVNGNQIYHNGSGEGIDLASTSESNAIAGNSIYTSIATGTGILVDCDYNVISGNQIHKGEFGIVVPSTGNAISGNVVNDPATWCLHLTGDNNAFSGNRWRKPGGSPTSVGMGTSNGVEYVSGSGYSMKYNHPSVT